MEYYKELIPFNGTLNYPSVYRGFPTLEIDAAWDRVSQDGEDCISLNIDTYKWLSIDPSS